ncbi:hypothetical protein WN51_03244 [Melipona quadrifasciata]|uniref:Uncharacterized protein n=1 Tax=Melipona quadrifasciata TaxID=166423 RepID=A0A0M8ZVT3_9HYME|nr:hypothetical protein WN51_03244 [Melipona quadrifasciata]
MSERVEKETGGHCGVNPARTFGSYESGMSNWSEICEHAVINTKQRVVSFN